MPRTLARLRARGSLSSSSYAHAISVWRSTVRTERRLTGLRARELAAVIANAGFMASGGALTASRVPEVFITLLRNRQWWSSGRPLTAGQRVEFAGSQRVWEYYPAQGLELQVLGSFGKADGLYSAGPDHYAQMLALVDEMIHMASLRGGKLAWEYLFRFESGIPPWTSAMSQATALEALTRAAAASRSLGQPDQAQSYMKLAHQAVALLHVRPPVGVAVAAPHGTRFLLYSFAPGERVINAFLQTLIGLYDYAQASGDRRAKALFAAGDAEARAELPAYDTGAWSLYEPGQEDTLDYHELVTGFLQSLCQRTAASVYCTTARRFQVYLSQPPAVSVPPISTTAAIAALVPITLSKISQVTLRVTNASGTTRFSWVGELAHGWHEVQLPQLRAGRYTITVHARDLAGNPAQTTAALTVKPRPRKRSKR